MYEGVRMNRWPDNSWHHWELGEALIAGGAENLYRGWEASTEVLGKLCTGASRWQSMIREMPSPVNFADILRARPLRDVAGESEPILKTR
jgi:hypothetical protein